MLVKSTSFRKRHDKSVTHLNNGIHLTAYADITKSLKDMSGAMKIVRLRSTFIGYYDSFGKWIPLNTERVD